MRMVEFSLFMETGKDNGSGISCAKQSKLKASAVEFLKSYLIGKFGKQETRTGLKEDTIQ